MFSVAVGIGAFNRVKLLLLSNNFMLSFRFILKYRMYQVRTKSSAKPLKFRLCDTRGLEDSQGIDAHDLTFLLDGNVPDGYHVSILYMYNSVKIV